MLKRAALCHLVALALILAAAAAQAGEAVTQEALLETGSTVAGEALRFPDRAPARIAAFVITLAPGAATGWHRHGTPMFAYLLAGELAVEYEGVGRRVYRQGDALLEAMAVAHNGTNIGPGPVRILAVFMEGEGAERTLPAPDAAARHAVPPAGPAKNEGAAAAP